MGFDYEYISAVCRLVSTAADSLNRLVRFQALNDRF